MRAIQKRQPSVTHYSFLRLQSEPQCHARDRPGCAPRLTNSAQGLCLWASSSLSKSLLSPRPWVYSSKWSRHDRSRALCVVSIQYPQLPEAGEWIRSLPSKGLHPGGEVMPGPRKWGQNSKTMHRRLTEERSRAWRDQWWCRGQSGLCSTPTAPGAANGRKSLAFSRGRGLQWRQLGLRLLRAPPAALRPQCSPGKPRWPTSESVSGPSPPSQLNQRSSCPWAATAKYGIPGGPKHRRAFSHSYGGWTFKTRVGRAVLAEASFLASSWLLVVAVSPGPSLAGGHSTPTSASWRFPSVSLPLCPNFPLLRTPVQLECLRVD